MLTPAEFMRLYRKLRVEAVMEDPSARLCRTNVLSVELRNYFMMDWTEGTEERRDFGAVTRGGTPNHAWFQLYKERIRTAAMGKGAPRDYELALEWAARSRKVRSVSQASLQSFCDEHLGIDCSGFVTNYLCACGKRTYCANTVRNTSAASYYKVSAAVNDPAEVRQGDLLVWMNGNTVRGNPGHVAVVESYAAQCAVGGNMRVVEATGAIGANPKLLDSMYLVEGIVPKGGAVPSMILVVRRHGLSGNRVSVIRV